LILILIFLAVTLNRAFIIRIEADFLRRLATDTVPLLFVAASACGRGFFQEEDQELVCGRKVRSLQELLEPGEADKHFEEGEGGANGA
jgi:hypothetical protein